MGGLDLELPPASDAVDAEIAPVCCQDERRVQFFGEHDQGGIGEVHRRISIDVDQLAAAP
jgi:hypothetical protein